MLAKNPDVDHLLCFNSTLNKCNQNEISFASKILRLKFSLFILDSLFSTKQTGATRFIIFWKL